MQVSAAPVLDETEQAFYNHNIGLPTSWPGKQALVPAPHPVKALV